ncbi:DUF4157 domain-containing protein [Streptomyces sp. NPDC094032]|uniref:eCIS core domain-containing protein n=1 Tax=Streptomyces sp. NPDC094032 TaxID=3155308 RepID=UPI0033299DC6
MDATGLLALQRIAGNSAVTHALQLSGYPYAQPSVQREEQHQHGAGCGHEQPAPVQRSAVHSVLGQTGRPLDAPLREEMEARLGTDFSDVRIHDDSSARASAAEIGAHAYTSGHHVVLGDGGADKHTLAHELTHVIQQRQGPVAGTDNGNGLRVSDPSDRYEREAEANATRVMSGGFTAGGHETEAVQRAAISGDYGQDVTIQRVPRLGQQNSTVSYDPLWAPGGSGSGMRADLIAGQQTGGGPPSTKPAWWPTGNAPLAGWFSRQMVQGHLLNHNLGGPGNTLSNLVPLTQSGNRQHSVQIEQEVKRLVGGGLCDAEYHVTADYTTHPTGAQVGLAGQDATDFDQLYSQYIPGKIHAEVTFYSPGTGREVQPADFPRLQIQKSWIAIDIDNF